MEEFANGAAIEVDQPPDTNGGDEQIDCAHDQKDDERDARICCWLLSLKGGQHRTAKKQAKYGKNAYKGKSAADD
ncbi:hypothetical protein RBB78_10335 [Tunturiibacter empetritectus]|uniref:hypothetical protein n=1 Tax=Tunturiibacter empetritectus TaxID=3069691 RepID=UPI003D9AF70F